MTELLPQYARSDARDNHHRILAATRTAVAAGGMRIRVRDVARQAGVAAATVYRHFPTKQILLTAAFTDRMAACAELLERGLADPDPGRGLRTAVEGARSPGWRAAPSAPGPCAPTWSPTTSSCC